jgi:hypothetical protein
MNDQDSKKSTQPLEGEGSYEATRRYNEHLRAAVEAGGAEAAADAARRALEGPEGAELKRAEQRGKAGPKRSTVSPRAGSSKK